MKAQVKNAEKFNESGVYVGDDVEKLTLPYEKKGWQGVPRAEICVVQIDNGRWISSLSWQSFTGTHQGRGEPLSSLRDYESREEAIRVKAEAILQWATENKENKTAKWAQEILADLANKENDNQPNQNKTPELNETDVNTQKILATLSLAPYPDEIPARFFMSAESSLDSDKLPKDEKKRQAKLNELLTKYCNDLQNDIRQYYEIIEKPDLNGNSTTEPLTNLHLKINHISYNKAKINACLELLGHQHRYPSGESPNIQVWNQEWTFPENDINRIPEYEAKGWKFEYDREKLEWSAGKLFGKSTFGISGHKGLHNIYGYLDKIDRERSESSTKNNEIAKPEEMNPSQTDLHKRALQEAKKYELIKSVIVGAHNWDKIIDYLKSMIGEDWFTVSFPSDEAYQQNIKEIWIEVFDKKGEFLTSAFSNPKQNVISAATKKYDEIPLEQIVPSDSEPQKNRQLSFTEENIQEMADSIKAEGVIQPILVRPFWIDGQKFYQIVAGERRWRGSKKAGLKEIPAVIRDLSDEQVIRMQLHENIKRSDPHPLEEAFTYDYMERKQEKSLEEIANEAGKKITYVAKRKRLIKLSDKVQEYFRKNLITVSHAEELVGFLPNEQDEILPLAFVNFGLTSQGLYPVPKFLENIQTHWFRQLKKAPFPLLRIDLAHNRSCGSCSERTRAQSLLFDNHIGLEDSCLNHQCWDQKKDIWESRKEDEGIQIRETVSTQPAANKTPKVTEKRSQYSSKEEEAEARKIGLKNQNDRFDQSVLEGVKKRIIQKILPNIIETTICFSEDAFADADHLASWFSLRSLVHLWHLQNDEDEDVAEEIVNTLGLEETLLYGDWQDRSFHFENILKLNETQRAKVQFLLIAKSLDTKEEIEYLANSFSTISNPINYQILDAEERLAQAPKDRKDEYRFYLHQLESGNRNAVMPNRYE